MSETNKLLPDCTVKLFMTVVASEKVMREKTLFFRAGCKKTPAAANCESLICLVFHLENIRVANLG